LTNDDEHARTHGARKLSIARGDFARDDRDEDDDARSGDSSVARVEATLGGVQDVANWGTRA